MSLSVKSPQFSALDLDAPTYRCHTTPNARLRLVRTRDFQRIKAAAGAMRNQLGRTRMWVDIS